MHTKQANAVRLQFCKRSGPVHCKTSNYYDNKELIMEGYDWLDLEMS